MNTNPEPVVVLMVDDDEEDAYATRRAFQEGKLANEFRHVKSGAELFDYLDNRGDFADRMENPRPHIILLDINMPEVGGLEVLEALRKNPTYRAIPVVMLTTSGHERDVLESYDRGANSFITKPVSVDGMLSVAQEFQSYWFQLVAIPKPTARADC